MKLSIEDQVLDKFWREHFEQPLPMIGAGQAVRAILRKQGVTDAKIDAAIRARQAETP